MGNEAQQNLRKYVSEGCEKAFAALVRKHAGMAALTSLVRKTASPADFASVEEDNAEVSKFVRKRNRIVRRELSRLKTPYD